MKSTSVPNPMTADHYDQLQQGLKHLHDANELIIKANAAGLDVRPHAEMHNYYNNLLTAVRDQFFIGGKPKP